MEEEKVITKMFADILRQEYNAIDRSFDCDNVATILYAALVTYAAGTDNLRQLGSDN
jgi:hypothetical protein